MTIVKELFKVVVEATLKRIKEDDRDYSMTHASSLGWLDSCKRHVILLRLIPKEQLAPTIEQQRIFDEGHRQEAVMRQELLDEGVDLVLPNVRKNIKAKKLTAEADNILIFHL